MESDDSSSSEVEREIKKKVNEKLAAIVTDREATKKMGRPGRPKKQKRKGFGRPKKVQSIGKEESSSSEEDDDESEEEVIAKHIKTKSPGRPPKVQKRGGKNNSGA